LAGDECCSAVKVAAVVAADAVPVPAAATVAVAVVAGTVAPAVAAAGSVVELLWSRFLGRVRSSVGDMV
jgi:hypothetical protein